MSRRVYGVFFLAWTDYEFGLQLLAVSVCVIKAFQPLWPNMTIEWIVDYSSRVENQLIHIIVDC